MIKDRVFDRARGLAILIMLIANSAPLMIKSFEPYFGFRMLCSLAAPLFVIVCALLVSLHAEGRKFSYYLQRGLFILAIGALVDISINRLMPFKGVDILYLVGVSIPLLYLAQKLKTAPILVLIGALFTGSIFLRQELGYHPTPLQMGIDGINQLAGNTPLIWKHWLVDGWFPLFPWLGIALSGILFKRWRYPDRGSEVRSFTHPKYLSTMGILLGFGLGLSLAFSSAYYIRYGYIELFYPPTLGFCIAAIASVGLMLTFCEWLQPSKALVNIEVIGNMPLAMYIVHLAAINYILHPLLEPISSVWVYAFACVFVAWILVVASNGIRMLRANYPNMPVPIRWIIGK